MLCTDTDGLSLSKFSVKDLFWFGFVLTTHWAGRMEIGMVYPDTIHSLECTPCARIEGFENECIF